jgi:hypothetical protein
VNCGIDRLGTVILEVLSLISQSKMYGDVAFDSNIEERLSFRSGQRNEHLLWGYPGNKIGASSIAFKVKIIFGSLYSIFVSRVIKKNRESTRHYSESC